MPAACSVWRSWRPARWGQQPRRQPSPGQLVRRLLAGWLLVGWLVWAPPAGAESTLTPQPYLCDGDPLTALLVKGPLDEPAIPDPSNAPVPIGGGVVLRWRAFTLQLPRTNNAGEASFSDGKWWWSLEDPAHPRFRLRQPLGITQDFACEAT